MLSLTKYTVCDLFLNDVLYDIYMICENFSEKLRTFSFQTFSAFVNACRVTTVF